MNIQNVSMASPSFGVNYSENFGLKNAIDRAKDSSSAFVSAFVTNGLHHPEQVEEDVHTIENVFPDRTISIKSAPYDNNNSQFGKVNLYINNPNNEFPPIKIGNFKWYFKNGETAKRIHLVAEALRKYQAKASKR